LSSITPQLIEPRGAAPKRLHCGAVPALERLSLFSVPLTELADRMIPADVAWGREALTIEDRINTTVDAHERSSLVQQFLLERAPPVRKPRRCGSSDPRAPLAIRRASPRFVLGTWEGTSSGQPGNGTIT